MKIGVLSVCRGQYAPFYGQTLAGAEIALVRHGAAPRTSDPSDGLRGAKVAGHEVKLVFGCSDDSGEQALAEARRLVEDEHVQVLVGPLTSAAGVAIRDYARTKPDVAFLAGPAPAAEVTLRDPAHNLFRFNADGIEASAGLGSYARRRLGWRNAVVVGDDFTYNYDEAAGFIAEFCSLGGRITKRVWIGQKPLTTYLRQIPVRGVDGYFVTVIFPQEALALVRAAPALQGRLGRKLVVGTTAALALGSGGLGARSLGVAAPLIGVDPRLRELAAFRRDFGKAFPSVPYGPLATSYFNAMEAARTALETTGGATGSRLVDALARTRIEGPLGPFRLDRNRQAIVTQHVTRVVRAPGGHLVQRTVRTLHDVDQSYAGRFTTSKPLPSRTNPLCRRGTVPRWARSA